MIKKLSLALLLISTFLLICTPIKYQLGSFAASTIQTPIAVLSAFYLSNNTRKIKYQLLFFIWFAIVVFQNYYMGDKYFSSSELTIFMLLSILLSVFLVSFIVKSSNVKFIKIFTLSQLIGIIIVCLLTILADQVTPGIVRNMVGFAIQGDTQSIQYYNRLGVCTYAFPHALPIIVPPLVHIYNKSKTFSLKVFAVSLIIIIGYLIYISGITTSLLLFMLSLFWSVYFSKSSMNTKSPKFIFFLLISFLLLFDDFQIGLLNVLDQLIPSNNDNVHVRIQEMIDSINGISTDDLGVRQDNYQLSLQLFFNDLLFGSNNQVGGHSSFLDIFASLGLLGGIPFILLIYFSFRFLMKSFPKDMRFTLLVSFFCFISMLAFKNANEINLWFFMFCLTPAIMRLETDNFKFFKFK